MAENGDKKVGPSQGGSSVGWNRRWPGLVVAGSVLAISLAVLFSVSGSAVAGPRIEKPIRVATYPHDERAFSQGLTFYNGRLLEGTGRYRQSTLRQVDLTTGNVEVRVPLPNNVFGEGIAVRGDEVFQLTWRSGHLIVYDAKTMSQKNTISYRQIDRRFSEGWGITHDGTHIVISDGTSYLRFVDPATWKMVRKLRVKSGGRPVSKLNELEYVNGEILANVWYSTRIARIDPKTGAVNSWLELDDIRPASVRRNREAVLNGIAWDEKNRRLYVTGKLWPHLYEIRYTGLPAAKINAP